MIPSNAQINTGLMKKVLKGRPTAASVARLVTAVRAVGSAIIVLGTAVTAMHEILSFLFGQILRSRVRPYYASS
jgi:hypothetical protein